MLKIKFSDDHRIIERIRKNDRVVLGELFIRHRKMVQSHLITRGGSAADVEDLLQEAIIVVWQKVNSENLELSAKLSTYIMAVVKNKWKAIQRKRSRISEDVPKLKLIENSSNLNDEKIKNERIELVHEALQKLNPLCKKLLLLFYFEERSMKDIAAILEFANVNVAKSKKYQCKKRLETILKEIISETEGGN